MKKTKVKTIYGYYFALNVNDYDICNKVMEDSSYTQIAKPYEIEKVKVILLPKEFSNGLIILDDNHKLLINTFLNTLTDIVKVINEDDSFDLAIIEKN